MEHMKKSKKLVYIAGPLFNDMECNRNTQIKDIVEAVGLDVYLPQDKVGRFSDLSGEANDKKELRKRIFDNDLSGVKACDIILCLLDGRVPDEGTCVELGMAYVLGKVCVGYKTDTRSMTLEGYDNIMITECIGGNIASNKEELVSILKKLSQRKLA